MQVPCRNNCRGSISEGFGKSWENCMPLWVMSFHLDPLPVLSTTFLSFPSRCSSDTQKLRHRFWSASQPHKGRLWKPQKDPRLTSLLHASRLYHFFCLPGLWGFKPLLLLVTSGCCCELIWKLWVETMFSVLTVSVGKQILAKLMSHGRNNSPSLSVEMCLGGRGAFQWDTAISLPGRWSSPTPPPREPWNQPPCALKNTFIKIYHSFEWQYSCFPRHQISWESEPLTNYLASWLHTLRWH